MKTRKSVRRSQLIIKLCKQRLHVGAAITVLLLSDALLKQLSSENHIIRLQIHHIRPNLRLALTFLDQFIALPLPEGFHLINIVPVCRFRIHIVIYISQNCLRIWKIHLVWQRQKLP